MGGWTYQQNTRFNTGEYILFHCLSGSPTFDVDLATDMAAQD